VPHFSPSLAVVVVLLLAGCARSVPEAELLTLSVQEQQVDLGAVLPGVWGRVCVLTPYTTNYAAKEVLGVSADVTGSSRIALSDGIALLATLREDEVDALYEVASSNVDFASLGNGCYAQSGALFSVAPTGHPYAVHRPR
jgi:hypothetical protein